MVKDFLKNGYKVGKGAIKGILEEYGVSESDHEAILSKLDNEINNEIKIEIENNSTSTAVASNNTYSGKPLDDYINERDVWKEETKTLQKEVYNLENQITKQGIIIQIKNKSIQEQINIAVDKSDNKLSSAEEFNFDFTSWLEDHDHLFISNTGGYNHNPNNNGLDIFKSTEQMNVQISMLNSRLSIEKGREQYENMAIIERRIIELFSMTLKWKEWRRGDND